MFGFLKKIFKRILGSSNDANVPIRQDIKVSHKPPPENYNLTIDGIFKDLEAESNDLVAKYN